MSIYRLDRRLEKGLRHKDKQYLPGDGHHLVGVSCHACIRFENILLVYFEILAYHVRYSLVEAHVRFCRTFSTSSSTACVARGIPRCRDGMPVLSAPCPQFRYPITYLRFGVTAGDTNLDFIRFRDCDDRSLPIRTVIFS